jgi:cation:H+ antiporter
MEHLIPDALFDGLGSPWLILLVLAALAVLVAGADRLVDSASAVAGRLGVPKVVIGATIVSLGTTSPECAVSVMAAWSGNSGLALGNGVGSIIADTALIFGLGAILSPLPADRFVLNRQGWVQLASAVLLAGLCYGAWLLHGDEAVVPRAAGLLLLALLVVYMVASIRWSQRHPYGEPFVGPEATAGIARSPAREQESSKAMSSLVLVGLLGLVLVLVGSRVLVGSVTVLAVRWGVPQVVLAATLVAVGTSVPELVVGMASIWKGHKEILVGNVIGADILNVLFVIGAAATATPLAIIDPSSVTPAIFLWLHLPAMVLVLVLFRLYIVVAVRRGSFSRWMGYPMIVLYGVYVILQFAVSLAPTGRG